MKAIVYVHVSTDEQAEHGLSLRTQESECRAFAAARGWAVVGVHGDPGISGGTPLNARPGLQAAIAQLQAGDALVVLNRSRLFRADPLIVALIEAEIGARGARVVSTAGEGTDSDSASSVFVRRIMDAQGEHWLNHVREGTRKALHEKRAAGERWGQIPYGFKLAPDGVHLEPAQEDAGLVEACRRLQAEGLSQRAIAAELWDLGFRPKEGGERWSTTSVRRILGLVRPWRAAKRARDLASALRPHEPHQVEKAEPCPPKRRSPRRSSISSATPSTSSPAACTPSRPERKSPDSPSHGSAATNAA